MDTSLHTTRLRFLLEEISHGNQAAKDELFERIDRRFTRLARQILAGFPRLQSLEQTDDVIQLARMRLLQAMGQVQFESMRTFFSLVAELLRRTLLDLTRHHFGRVPRAQIVLLDPAHEVEDARRSLAQLRREIHEIVELLAPDERELVYLLYYHGCSQEEVAVLLGVHARTVQRQWLHVKARLLQLLRE